MLGADASMVVSHGSEVNFVFGNVADPAPGSQALSTVMIDYWVSFATSLDPNDGRGTRREYSNNETRALVLTRGSM